ncbi:MAG: fatty acid desaturase family protein [Chitinophagales bacterium]|nr:fatty acid desaturase family protein [Chitinophagales bacterium]MDW8274109.1 fatty acid desaturase family protein [Chitinophagales bacterium]
MANHLMWYNKTLKEYLTHEEIQRVMKKNNLRAAWEIAQVWLWILFAFALVYIWPNPFTIIISLFILGGKQLGCAIIMHDCSHDSMFTSRKLNEWIGNWFGAFPIFHDLRYYRPYHTQHHIHTGSDEDPDLSLTKGYPTTAVSMARKFLRDLFGASGIKAQTALILMHFGYLKYHLGGLLIRIKQSDKSLFDILKKGFKSLAGPLAANAVIFLLCWLSGKPWLYLLWVGALFTTYNFSLRVRSMAEHSLVEDRNNPHKNTRTTYANFIERILFAPLHVNYHAEHHLCMGAPSYNLPLMHKLLKERGYYKEGALAPNYLDVIKKAIVPAKTASA